MEGIVNFYNQTGSIAEAQRRFKAHFRTKWAPVRKTVMRLAQKYASEGTVDYKKIISKQDGIIRARRTLAAHKSLRRYSKRNGISKIAIQGVLSEENSMNDFINDGSTLKFNE